MLAISPCLTLCDWAPTATTYGGEPLLRCGGCLSEWVPSERWTPRQADGSVPDAVRESDQRG